MGCLKQGNESGRESDPAETYSGNKDPELLAIVGKKKKRKATCRFILSGGLSLSSANKNQSPEENAPFSPY